MLYKYITKNNLYDKQTYMYSKYAGRTFLAEYLDSRNKYLTWWKNNSGNLGAPLKIDTYSGIKVSFIQCLDKLENGDVGHNDEIFSFINECVKSFEVRKRIYVEYDDNWKPLERAGFEDYENYLLFAEILICVYKRTGCMKYLSCLLKLDDTLLSVYDCMSSQCREQLYHVIIQEINIFHQLMMDMGLDKEGVIE